MHSIFTRPPYRFSLMDGVVFLVRFLHSNDAALQLRCRRSRALLWFRVGLPRRASDPCLVEPCGDDITAARASRSLHNLTLIPFLCAHAAGCLPGVVKLLGSCSHMACAAAAGTIQNISREPASRELLLHKHAATEPLSDLLFGSDVQAQACAAGALLNIMGPDLGGDGPEDSAVDTKVEIETRAKNTEARTAFKKLLAESIAMGTIWQTLFEEGEES